MDNKKGYQPRTAARQNQTWVFGPSYLQAFFRDLFGSTERPDGKKSKCAAELNKMADRHRNHSRILRDIGRYIEAEEATRGAKTEDTVSYKKVKSLNDKIMKREAELSARTGQLVQSNDTNEALKTEIGGLNRRITELTRQRDEAENSLQKAERMFEHRLDSIRDSLTKVGDADLMRAKPVSWGQAVDSLGQDLPEALECVDFDKRILPRDHSRDGGSLGSHYEDDGRIVASSFVASKKERGEARWSEDRIGFQSKDDGFRAVALDGVGGSVHPRHLVRFLASSLLDSDEVIGTVEDALERFGKTMTEDNVSFSEDEKLAAFQMQRLNKGASCVFSVVDYNAISDSVVVSHIGDSVAFVETVDGWKVVPEEFSQGKEFDSMPAQVKTSDVGSADRIRITTVGEATGRVAVATDGVASHILEGDGIEAFISKMEAFGEDGEGFLRMLRGEGIDDDDLSFLMVSYPSFSEGDG